MTRSDRTARASGFDLIDGDFRKRGSVNVPFLPFFPPANGILPFSRDAVEEAE